MVYQFHDPKKNIKAHDVIILGCTLPGIVAAHKLKKRFGDTVDVLVIDLVRPTTTRSQATVGFFLEKEDNDPVDVSEDCRPNCNLKEFLYKYTDELDIPIPDAIISPRKCRSSLNKLFQYIDGNYVPCLTDFHDFEYLNWLEKFELNQFQTLLEENMKVLFQTGQIDTSERSVLHSWDQTTMEKYICECLLFRTSREIMRLTVKLICGAPADQVSLLFYLHQCYRNTSPKNCFDGDNVRLREKVLGYCRKKLSTKLQQSVEDIILKIKLIVEIRSYSDEQVILQTRAGESDFVCNLLAMAITPEDLKTILIHSELITPVESDAAKEMIHGNSKRFMIQYGENFWRKYGFSGEIVSIRGPIVWAIEKPKLSTIGSEENYATLIGYLKTDNDEESSKEAVIEQLIKLFGEEAADPIDYNETLIRDIFIPRCGDYIALSKMTKKESHRLLEWAPFDVYADGDLAAALEAGHNAYLNLLRSIRPQAITFEDARMSEPPTILPDQPFTRWRANLNFMRGIYYAVIATVLIGGYKLIRSRWK